MTDPASGETVRLENLWQGDFGDAYVERNKVLDDRRAAFWSGLLARHPIGSVLEVGCGQGANLGPISRILPPSDVWGVDVNATALERARLNSPGVNVVTGVARELPFRDRFVDLVFTMGVLIHQPDAALPIVLAEIVRCSTRFILWGEYHAARTEPVPYHGVEGALFRRDYRAIYHQQFPALVPRDEGFLGPEDGFDRVTWQLLERS
jgi:pseudaminic acid biosynthesis-associated methylase